MASGEVATVEPAELAELPLGSVVTSSGRISGVTEPGELSVSVSLPGQGSGLPRRRAEVRLPRGQGAFRGLPRRSR